MKKTSVTVKAAWISSIALIVSTIMAGGFLLLDSETANADRDNFNSLLMHIPPGSKVTVLVESKRTGKERELEAIFEKIVNEQAELRLIESEEVKEIMRKQGESKGSAVVIGEPKVEELTDYIVFYDAELSTARIVQVDTGGIIYSKTFQ